MLSEEEIKKIATLARLELTPEQMKKFSKELTEILDFFEQLQEVNTDGTEPTAQITGLQKVLRPDEVKDCEVSEQLLKASPNSIENNHITVNSVL